MKSVSSAEIMSSYPAMRAEGSTTRSVPSKQELEQVYWHHVTSTHLMNQDVIAWGFGFAFVWFVMSIIGFDPAFCVCLLQMSVQILWMITKPASYKRHREQICFVIRVWRAYMVYRLPAGFTFGVASAKPMWRSLFVASGSLINFVMPFAYQLKFSTHVFLQLVATGASIVAGTRNVVEFVSQKSNLPMMQQLYCHMSEVSSIFAEGISFTGHQPLGCKPSEALVVVLMLQTFLGFILPTYILLFLELASRQRLNAFVQQQQQQYEEEEQQPQQQQQQQQQPMHHLAMRPTSSSRVCAFFVTLLTHALLLALIASTLWEALCSMNCRGVDADWLTSLDPFVVMRQRSGGLFRSHGA